MTQLLTRSPSIRHGDNTIDWRTRRSETPGDAATAAPPADGPTLADVIDRAWEVLGAELPAACPVCGGELTPQPPVVGGRCESCGSTLS